MGYHGTPQRDAETEVHCSGSQHGLMPYHPKPVLFPCESCASGGTAPPYTVHGGQFRASDLFTISHSLPLVLAGGNACVQSWPWLLSYPCDSITEAKEQRQTGRGQSEPWGSEKGLQTAAATGLCPRWRRREARLGIFQGESCPGARGHEPNSLHSGLEPESRRPESKAAGSGVEARLI